MTDAELLALAQRLIRHEIAWDMSPECQALTPGEERTVLAFLSYSANTHRACDRRARALFRSWLTADQRRELRIFGRVRIVGSAGGRYDISPTWGRSTSELERHGKNWYRVAWFCYHDVVLSKGDERALIEGGFRSDDIDAVRRSNKVFEVPLPQADVALAHMLFLLTDESWFRSVANRHPIAVQSWDGAYRRRLNAARRGRSEDLAQEIAAARARVIAGESQVAA